jgi:hypothetical protein
LRLLPAVEDIAAAWLNSDMYDRVRPSDDEAHFDKVVKYKPVEPGSK